MAEKIDGKAIAQAIHAEVRAGAERLRAERGIVPGLATVLVGDDPASRSYVAAKRKACAEDGIASFPHELAPDVPPADLLGILHDLAQDDRVHGILVQLPLPRHVDERQVLAQVGATTFDPEAVRALAAKYRVDSLVVGALDAQRVSPKFAFDSGAWMTASAVLEGSLHVRILDARTGATLWSNLARAREEVARMNVSGAGVSGVGANPPDEARERMIERLINRSTDDFWAHWR